MNTRSSLLLSVVLLAMSAGARAQDCTGPYYIDQYDNLAGIYTIGFHKPTDGSRPIVWPPDRSNPVPMGQHSSGQVIAELEAELGINGTILSLLDAMNALHACIYPDEAERWRKDPRVAFVEHNSPVYQGLSPAAQDAQRNNPQLSFDAGYTLTLPLIDFGAIPGQYQYARIDYQPATQSWRLTGYRKGVPMRNISAVDLVVTSEVPAQVFLDIRGTLNNGCSQVGESAVRHEDNDFNVYLFYQYVPPDCLGTTDVRNFRKVIPLDVYGLPAGTYTWTLNDQFSGSFTLPQDNVLD